MKKKKIYVLLIFMIFVLIGCSRKPEEKEENAIITEKTTYSFDSFQAQLGDVSCTKEVTCTYRYASQQSLNFLLEDSLVEEVYVKVGDFVEEGQLLASLDIEDKEKMIPDMEYEIAQLEMKLEQEKQLLQFELASADILFSYTKESLQDKEALAAKKEEIELRYQYAIEDYEDQLVIKKSRLEEYITMVKGGRIYAPFRGEISYVISGLKGSYTDAETVVIRIGEENSSCFVSTDGEQAGSFEEGQVYVIKTQGLSAEESFQITPTRYDDWGDELYFSLVDEGNVIPSGTIGNMNWIVDEEKNVLCVPIESIHSTGDSYFVYVLEDENRSMQYVEVGLLGDEFVEIISGIEIGTRVILE